MNTVYENIYDFYVFVQNISESIVWNLTHDLDCSLTVVSLLTGTNDLISKVLMSVEVTTCTIHVKHKKRDIPLFICGRTASVPVNKLSGGRQNIKKFKRYMQCCWRRNDNKNHN